MSKTKKEPTLLPLIEHEILKVLQRNGKKSFRQLSTESKILYETLPSEIKIALCKLEYLYKEIYSFQLKGITYYQAKRS